MVTVLKTFCNNFIFEFVFCKGRLMRQGAAAGGPEPQLRSGSTPSHLPGKGSQPLTACPLVTRSHLASSSLPWSCYCCHSQPGVLAGSCWGVGGGEEGPPSAIALSSLWEPQYGSGEGQGQTHATRHPGWGQMSPLLSESAAPSCDSGWPLVCP